MLIALLAVLGVDLIVIVVLLASALSRKRWVKRRPGAFRGAIRVASGEIDGLGSRWVRGYGRWVRDVLVWTKAPLLFRNEILATDGLDGRRPARPDEVKRLGDHPVVVRVRMGSAMAELAARGDDGELAAGRYGVSAEPAAEERPRGAAMSATGGPRAESGG
jgi:hypothetical protein